MQDLLSLLLCCFQYTLFIAFCQLYFTFNPVYFSFCYFKMNHRSHCSFNSQNDIFCYDQSLAFTVKVPDSRHVRLETTQASKKDLFKKIDFPDPAISLISGSEKSIIFIRCFLPGKSFFSSDFPAIQALFTYLLSIVPDAHAHPAGYKES